MSSSLNQLVCEGICKFRLAIKGPITWSLKINTLLVDGNFPQQGKHLVIHCPNRVQSLLVLCKVFELWQAICSHPRGYSITDKYIFLISLWSVYTSRAEEMFADGVSIVFSAVFQKLVCHSKIKLNSSTHWRCSCPYST